MNYFELLQCVKKLKKNYNVKVIGKTKFNRKIIAVEKILNKSFSTAILIAGMHARENISADLLLEMIEQNLFKDVKEFNLSFILLSNPDGVELQSKGLAAFPKPYHNALIKMNGGASDFSMWKANALGVDLNNNFDARWGTNSHSSRPSSHGFIGDKAMSEKETRAIANYTKKMKPFITISYHTKGEEIYFNFFQDEWRKKRDEKIAMKFAESTGYKIVNVESSSSGGYKDWCVEKLNIPALTIELGSDDLSHPIGKKHLKDIFVQNKMIASDLIFAYNEFVKAGEI